MLGRGRPPKPVTAGDSLGLAARTNHRRALPHADELRRTLEGQLQVLALRSASSEYSETAIAFVAQAHRERMGSYAEWRGHWDRRLRSEPTGRYSAATWPASVQPDSWSVVLLPVEPGVVRSSAAVVRPGRRARRAGAVAKGTPLPLSLAGQPVAAHIDDRLMRGRTPQDITISLVSSWISMLPDDATLVSQAPVLELTRADGTVVDRELVSWGLSWPLAAPAIDIPPPARDLRLDDRRERTPDAPAVRPLRRRRR